MIEIKIDTLYEALEKKVKIELKRAEKDQEEFDYWSQVLHCDLEEKTIIIDVPRGSPDLEDLKTNDQIVVNFIHKESPFIFNSSVVGLVQVGPPGEQPEQAVVIALPETISGEEKIHLEGEVKNVYQFENSRETVFDIMFKPRALDKLSFKKKCKEYRPVRDETGTATADQIIGIP